MPTQQPPRISAAHCAFFLDFDGTLVHFGNPDEIVPVVDDGLRALLLALRDAADGALAVVSGRTVAAIDGLFEPLTLASSGEHGGEWRHLVGHELQSIPVPPGLDAAHKVCEVWSAATPGTMFERKGLSLVLHFHRHPELREAAAAVAESVCTPDSGLRMLHARGMVEIRPVAADKGVAIRRFMELPPYAGRTPVFLGDDVTDEDGFTAVNAMDGISVKVGPGPSHARFRLPSEDAVREWLESLIEPALRQT